jgi:hypothetical protein
MLPIWNTLVCLAMISPDQIDIGNMSKTPEQIRFINYFVILVLQPWRLPQA